MVLKNIGQEVGQEVLAALRNVEEVFRRYEASLVVEECWGRVFVCNVKRVPRFRRQALRDEVRKALGNGFMVSGGEGSERLRIESSWAKRRVPNGE